MELIIDAWSDLQKIDSKILDQKKIKMCKLIGDTYYVLMDDDFYFACHRNFWSPYLRERKINLIVGSD